MFEVSAGIIYNRRIKKGYFEIALSAPAIAKTALPGQFVNIKVSAGLEPLLRRPLSIHRVEGNKIFLLYEVLGKGTEMLSRKKQGEYLDIIGPLGSGFRLNEPRTSAERSGASPKGTNHKSRILVAGGMGTAPLVFLAERLNKRWTKPACRQGRDERRRTLVLIGAKTKDSILCEKEFKELGCEVMVSTDDGSRGFKGYVSELLKQRLLTIDCRLSTIYACGPKLLLKEISRISYQRNIPAQLSLESHMACGIGACMGCVIKVARAPERQSARDFEYKRVCKEGPVFEVQEIIW